MKKWIPPLLCAIVLVVCYARRPGDSAQSKIQGSGMGQVPPIEVSTPPTLRATEPTSASASTRTEEPSLQNMNRLDLPGGDSKALGEIVLPITAKSAWPEIDAKLRPAVASHVKDLFPKLNPQRAALTPVMKKLNGSYEGIHKVQAPNEIYEESLKLKINYRDNGTVIEGQLTFETYRDGVMINSATSPGTAQIRDFEDDPNQLLVLFAPDYFAHLFYVEISDIFIGNTYRNGGHAGSLKLIRAVK